MPVMPRRFIRHVLLGGALFAGMSATLPVRSQALYTAVPDWGRLPNGDKWGEVPNVTVGE